jgi:ribosomal protein L11 methyltransferase
MARARTPKTVRIVLETKDRDTAERAAAEAFVAGALGLEERDGEEPACIRFLLYAPSARGEAVRAAVAAVLGVTGSVGEPEAVNGTDWSEAWKEGLGPIEIGPRLVIRPSWVSLTPRPGQHVLVIDPKQAFGTGAHASTRLALELLHSIADELPTGAQVLDVGTGSGVLALAALALGAARAVAFDLDPLAGEAATENAVLNGVASGLRLFTGSVEALAEVPFDLVLANLLRNEVTPLLPALARRTRPGGRAIFTGLLDVERAEMEGRLAAVGFTVEQAILAEEADGDAWLGLLTRR